MDINLFIKFSIMYKMNIEIIHKQKYNLKFI